MGHPSPHKKHSGTFWHNQPQYQPEVAPKKGLDEYVDAHHSDTSSQGKRHDAIAGQTGTRTTPINRPALALAAYRNPDLVAQAMTSIMGGKAFEQLLELAGQIEREMSPEEIQRELSQYKAQEEPTRRGVINPTPALPRPRPRPEPTPSVTNNPPHISPQPPSQPPPVPSSPQEPEQEISPNPYMNFCSSGEIHYLEEAVSRLSSLLNNWKYGGKSKKKTSRCKLACWLMEIGNAYRPCQYGVKVRDIEKAKRFYKEAAELGLVEAEVAIDSMQGA